MSQFILFSKFRNHTVSQPIATNLTSSIHMEDFPVATKDTLSKLDILKKEIMSSDFRDRSATAPSGLAPRRISPKVNVSEHNKEYEHHQVSHFVLLYK